VYLSYGPIGQQFYCFCDTSVREKAWRSRERRTLLAGGGTRASRSRTLAASQAFECMHMFVSHRVKTYCRFTSVDSVLCVSVYSTVSTLGKNALRRAGVA
jgi:hypothetical protein